MKISDVATLGTIIALALGGLAVVGKLAGSALFVDEEDLEPAVVHIGKKEFITGEAYQQEKLDDLQEEQFDLEAKKQFEGDLTQREQEKLKRLMKRIERLEGQIQ